MRKLPLLMVLNWLKSCSDRSWGGLAEETQPIELLRVNHLLLSLLASIAGAFQCFVSLPMTEGVMACNAAGITARESFARICRLAALCLARESARSGIR